MGATAHGRILFWEGASLWIFSAPPGEQYPRTDLHAHHAVQVTLALRGDVDFEGEGDGERVEGVAIAISPDARHSFRGTGLVAHLFVAPEGQAGRAIASSSFAAGPIATIPPRRLGDLPARLRAAYENPRATDEALTTLGRELVATLAGASDRTPVYDARVDRAIAWMSARLDQPVTLAAIAKQLGLSPGRARHLFVEQTGLPFRTYVLWLRVVRAVEIFAGGDSLTAAAHGAGFADQAHLSRTFRRMFGVSAATLRVSPPAARRR